MSDDEDIAALVVDNGSGMCKGEQMYSQRKHAVIVRLWID